MPNPLPEDWTEQDVEYEISRNIPEDLLYIPISVSMCPPDCAWSQEICIRLSSHPHPNVRGNAVLGFGHLARTCGSLDFKKIQPIIEDALKDADDFVRGQAHSAAQDIHVYLDIVISGYDTADTEHFYAIAEEFLIKHGKL